MSQQEWFDDSEDDETDEPQAPAQPNPRDLRSQLKAALKAKKDLENELSTVKGQVRKANIGSYFTAKGINPKLAKYVPSDLDPTTEALDKWVAEDGELFNITPKVDGDENKPSDPASGTPGTPGLTGDNITPDVQAAWNQINNTTANTLPPGKAEDFEAAMSKINTGNPTSDYEALKALMFSHGASSF